MTTHDIHSMIEAGEADDDLDMIVESIQLRRKVLQARILRDIEVGEVVMFNHKVRPKYLEGVFATVTGRNGSKLRVELDHDVGRFSANTRIDTPIGIVDRITDDESGVSDEEIDTFLSRGK